MEVLCPSWASWGDRYPNLMSYLLRWWLFKHSHRWASLIRGQLVQTTLMLVHWLLQVGGTHHGLQAASTITVAWLPGVVEEQRPLCWSTAPSASPPDPSPLATGTGSTGISASMSCPCGGSPDLRPVQVGGWELQMEGAADDDLTDGW